MNLQQNNTSNPLVVQAPGTTLSLNGVPLQPPASNTGVSVTSIIDYLTFTMPACLVGDGDIKALLNALLVSDYFPIVEDLERGFLGYKQKYQLCEGGYIGVGGNAGTAYVSLSSSALAYMQVQGCDVLGWIVYIKALGVKVKRIDLAFDDFGGLVTITKVQDLVKSGGVITRSHLRRYIESEEYDIIGATCEFGSRTSDTFVRIYDKAAQQKVRNFQWTRVEVQYNGDRADAVLVELVSAGLTSKAAVSILLGSIDFRTNNGTVNKTRWERVDWWQKFTSFIEGVKVVISRATRTIEDIASWLTKSVSGAMAAFHQVYGQEGLEKLLERGYRVISPSHQRMVGLATI